MTTILKRIFEMRKKVVELSVSFSNSSFRTIVMIPSLVKIVQLLLFIDIIKDILDKIEKLLIK